MRPGFFVVLLTIAASAAIEPAFAQAQASFVGRYSGVMPGRTHAGNLGITLDITSQNDGVVSGSIELNYNAKKDMVCSGKFPIDGRALVGKLQLTFHRPEGAICAKERKLALEMRENKLIGQFDSDEVGDKANIELSMQR